MFGILVAFLSPFVGLSSESAFVRAFFKDNIDLPVYFTNCLFIMMASTVVLGLVVWGLDDIIGNLLSIPKLLVLVAFCVPIFNYLISFPLSIWRLSNKTFSYSLFEFSQVLLVAVLSIIFVVNFGWGWEGRIAATVLVSFLFSIVAFYLICKLGFMKIRLHISYVKQALNYSTPLIPHVLGGQLITMTDRLFLTNMIGIAETGLYAVGFAVGNVVKIIEYSFYLAYQPWLFSKLKTNTMEMKRKIVRISYLFSFFILFFALLLSGLAHLTLEWFIGNKFMGAGQFVFWISAGFAFNGMYTMVSQFILYSEKTYFTSAITSVSIAVNLPLNYFLIKHNGGIGAAQATALTFLFRFIIAWIVSAKVYPMPWFYFWLKVK